MIAKNLPRPQIDIGKVVMTPGAIRVFEQSNQPPIEFLVRHLTGDWGDIDQHDWDANDQAIASGDRVLSSYTTDDGTKIWIVTEADRSSTCILLPDEY